jgi:serine/threonine-protein kinase
MQVGGRIGDWELVQPLGAGGQGTVWAVVHTRTNITAALKLLTGRDAASLTRFRREIEIIRELDHPHVVRLQDYDVDGPEPYVVMDLYRGGSLADVLARDGRLSAGQAARVIAALADALAAAHARGIVHRDVKPSNVLLDRNGNPYLADFGVAHVGMSGLTGTGGVVGSAGYMAPELFDGASASAATDAFALGVLGWELLTGGRPYTRLDDARAGRRGSLPDDVPPEVASALDGLLAAATEQRTMDLHGVADQLGAIRSERLRPIDNETIILAGAGAAREARARTGEAETVATKPNRRRGVVVALVALAILLLGGVGFAATALLGDDGSGQGVALEGDDDNSKEEVDEDGNVPPPTNAAGEAVDATPVTNPETGNVVAWLDDDGNVVAGNTDPGGADPGGDDPNRDESGSAPTVRGEGTPSTVRSGNSNDDDVLAPGTSPATPTTKPTATPTTTRTTTPPTVPPTNPPTVAPTAPPTTAPPPSHAPINISNLVVNPGFETGTSGWNLSNVAGGAVNGNAYAGSWFLQFKGAESRSIWQTIPWSPSSSQYLGATVRAFCPGPANCGGTLAIWAYNKDTNAASKVGDAGFTISPGRWYECRLDSNHNGNMTPGVTGHWAKVPLNSDRLKFEIYGSMVNPLNLDEAYMGPFSLGPGPDSPDNCV